MAPLNFSKPFDLIVFGATGFTGKLVVSYLASHPQPPKRWAISGRSMKKLTGIKNTLKLPVNVELLVADSSDEESLKQLCQKGKVIMTTVGPYIPHGELLYKTCAETGTHYLDLTGETPWIAAMISRYESVAQSSGAIMISSAGFDSIPSDLGSYLAIRSLRAISPKSEISKVKTLFNVSGGFSAGTLETVEELFKHGRKLRNESTLNKNMTYMLSPITGKEFKFTLARRFENNIWGGFWFMAPHNTLIVRRTWSLLELWKRSGVNVSNYGPDFDYDEYFRVPTGNRILAYIWTVTWMFGLVIYSLLPPLRRLIKWLLVSGRGPSEKVQNSGWYTTTTIAESSDGHYFGKCKIKAKGDPGYKATSPLIAEMALILVYQYDQLPDHIRRGGAFTPALVGGDMLAERLERTETTGVRIETDAWAWEKLGKRL